MDICIQSLGESTRFHEIKLFFIMEHFDILSIYQLNQLVDIYLDVLNRSDYKNNPVLSQYNTIKYALLILRISWKIEEKKIYSLITKCTALNAYINKSIQLYLEK